MPHATPEQNSPNAFASLVQAFALLATASAAARVVRALHDRRDGCDPSDLTPPARARTAIAADARELRELLYPLYVSFVAGADQDDGSDVARLTRQFDLLQRFSQAVALLHRVHQHLMSLFPEVSEDVVEEARELHLEAQSTLQHAAHDDQTQAVALAERALILADRLERAA